MPVLLFIIFNPIYSSNDLAHENLMNGVKIPLITFAAGYQNIYYLWQVLER
ncbi:hypothetical protein EVA_11147 [gut metagenome]|uniref:Uncharacterized protein n=1 Tax=gut metagenome TaxID=749906 RepID=J9GG24_9ZZZZ